MVNDDLREFSEETEEETTEETEEKSSEETEEETSEETEEESSEEIEEETSEETEEENSYDPEFSSYETILLTSPDSIDSNDYSTYFENLQSLGIIITAFILGLGLSLAFVIGFKKNE